MNFKIIQAGIQLLKELIPLAITLIQVINDAIPEAKQGALKLELLLSALRESVKDLSEFAEEAKEKAISIITKFTEVYVEVRKKISGKF